MCPSLPQERIAFRLLRASEALSYDHHLPRPSIEVKHIITGLLLTLIDTVGWGRRGGV